MLSPSNQPGSHAQQRLRFRDSMKQFTAVYETIEQNYADPVNADKEL